MKTIKLLKILTLSLGFFYLGTITGRAAEPSSNCHSSKNIWYKISTDDLTYGDIIRIDMSRGQAYSDQYYIYILAKDIDTGEVIIVAFPNGGDWIVQTPQDSIYFEMEEEINTLQKYVESKTSTEIKKLDP